MINPPVYPPFFDDLPEAGRRVVEVPLARDGAAGRSTSTGWRRRSPAPRRTCCARRTTRSAGCGGRTSSRGWPSSPTGTACSCSPTRSTRRWRCRASGTCRWRRWPATGASRLGRDQGVERGRAEVRGRGDQRRSRATAARPAGADVRYRSGHPRRARLRGRRSPRAARGWTRARPPRPQPAAAGRAARRPAARVGYRPPEASFLAWLDLRRTGSVTTRRGVPRARPGRAGARAWVRPAGRRHARLNLGTTRALLTEAVVRFATALSERTRLIRASPSFLTRLQLPGEVGDCLVVSWYLISLNSS